MLTEAILLSACKAAESLFVFLGTPEGQLLAKEWREDRAKLKADFEGLAGWLKPLVGGLKAK